MSDPKEYYKILGLEKKCNEKDIKKSYRKLALKYHPDKNPGDKQSEDMFKKISEAYHVLSDKDKRGQYDNVSKTNPFTFTTQQNFNPFDIFKHFQHSQHSQNAHNVNFSVNMNAIHSAFNNNKQFSTNFTCYTQTVFKDGKKYVTTTETKNGKTTKKEMVSDSKTNKQIQ